MYWIVFSNWAPSKDTEKDELHLLGIIHQNNLNDFMQRYFDYHDQIKFEEIINTQNFRSWEGVQQTSLRRVKVSVSVLDKDVDFFKRAPQFPDNKRNGKETLVSFSISTGLEEELISHRKLTPVNPVEGTESVYEV